MLKIKHTIKDSRPSIEEDKREKLIITPEEDLLPKTKINIIHQNTDLLQEEHAQSLSAKLFTKQLREIRSSAQLNLQN